MKKILDMPPCYYDWLNSPDYLGLTVPVNPIFGPSITVPPKKPTIRFKKPVSAFTSLFSAKPKGPYRGKKHYSKRTVVGGHHYKHELVVDQTLLDAFFAFIDTQNGDI